jgi:hypothetical protein
MKQWYSIDIIVTGLIAMALYFTGAPWWMYLAMLAFGTAQRLIGKKQEQHDAAKREFNRVFIGE